MCARSLVCVDALVMGTYRNLHIYLHLLEYYLPNKPFQLKKRSETSGGTQLATAELAATFWSR